MDYLEQPEIKETYNRCKYIVKLWEHKFKKKYKRTPSKLDIRDADQKVRHAYRKYFQIKTAALEQSFRDVEGFNSDEEKDAACEQTEVAPDPVQTEPMPVNETENAATWGTHLDNQPQENELEETKNQTTSKSSLNLKIAQKLFCGAKFSKRNPRKSLSFTQKRSNKASAEEGSRSFSQPEPAAASETVCRLSFEGLFSSQNNSTNNIKVSTRVSEQTCSQPINLIQSIVQGNYHRKLNTVDQGWLQRIEQNINLGLNETQDSSQEYPPDPYNGTDEDIIEQSDEEEISLSQGPQTKKAKLSDSFAGPSSVGPKLTEIVDRQRHSSSPILAGGGPSMKKLISSNSSSDPSQVASTANFSDVKLVPQIGPQQGTVGSISDNSQSFRFTHEDMVVTDSDNDKDDESNSHPTSDVHKLKLGKQANSASGDGELKTKSFVKKVNKSRQVSDSEGEEIVLSENPTIKVQSGRKKSVRRKPARKKAVKQQSNMQNDSTKNPTSDAQDKKISKTGKSRNIDANEKAKRLSLRKNKTSKSMAEPDFSGEERDPYASDNDSDDPEFSLSSSKTSKKSLILVEPTENTSISKTKRTKSIKNSKREQETIENDDDKVSSAYELEYSVKPRLSVPRFKNLKKLIELETAEPAGVTREGAPAKGAVTEKCEPKVLTKREQEREKFLKKIESGSLNDNYVTINLKKKIYVRGHKSVNYSRYKYRQWKDKKKAAALCGPEMDMGGCDGGQFTCFVCGKTGHFAQRCPQNKGDMLLPLSAAEKNGEFEEQESTLPTLEEAAQIARESAWAIRKPNIEGSDVSVQQKLIEDGNEQQEKRNLAEKSIVGDKENSEISTSKNETTELDKNKNENDENPKHGSSDSEEWTDDELFEDLDPDKLLADTLNLDAQATKLDLRMYTDETRKVEPFYRLKEDGEVIDTPEEVFTALSRFGHTSFREGQERAVMRILSGKSTLVTLSTGSGKSLCYQLPAYLYAKKQRCISLVISPLVSLMEDQVTGLPAFLRAACLHTNQTKGQRDKVWEAISSGDLHILLVSPEAVVAGEKSTGFGSLLRKLPPIAFACIDEAHCVSQWSHNFRPSYLMICRVLKEKMGVNTVLGLTATATRATSQNIIDHLQIPDGFSGVIMDTPLPENLQLSVSKDHQREQALLALLHSDRFAPCRSIIVYCTRRQECDKVAGFLRTSLQYTSFQQPNNIDLTQQEDSQPKNKKRKRTNVQAEPYHAGLSASKRRTVQKSFMNGELRIVVATVAFGMGINKRDIRAVIHYNMPKSFESYVQEIGRAGRDGLPAHCHLFLDSKGNDENELRRHIHANSIDRHVIRKLLQKVFVPCSCPEHTECPKHEVAFSIEDTVRLLDIPEENISTLLCYLELHENKYVEMLSPAYTRCKIISYGGPDQIKKAAKDCAPLAMALALQKKNNNKENSDKNVFEFAVIDIAAAIGWDSGICKHKLKNLEWTAVNNQPKRSLLSVQFSDLGFRMLSPGNLSDDQLDQALDNLYEHVKKQEETSLLQLHSVHQVLVEVASPTYNSCLVEEQFKQQSDKLKGKIREYFESPDPLENVQIPQNPLIDDELVIRNVRGLVTTYKDNCFTGRAIARIFHGISSPNYPAVMWGRCKYWRCLMNVDFNHICRIATGEILKLR